MLRIQLQIKGPQEDTMRRLVVAYGTTPANLARMALKHFAETGPVKLDAAGEKEVSRG